MKPDNIGFTKDGKLKLFDFGLSTCVRKRCYDSEVYDMTGMTGSLRYMAPEVALHKPYNEKVDVHSFGIILWQIASDKIPFDGLSISDFKEFIVNQGYRLVMPTDWPKKFRALLNSCWDKNIISRPNFYETCLKLDELIRECEEKDRMMKEAKSLRVGCFCSRYVV